MLYKYSLSDRTILYVQLNMWPIEEEFYTRYRLDKSNKSEIKGFIQYNVDEKQVVPVSIDDKAYTNPLVMLLSTSKTFIRQFSFKFKTKEFFIKSNPTDKKDFLSKLDVNYNFYLVSLNGFYNIIGIHIVSPTHVNKVRISIHGNLIESINDIVLPDGLVERTINNKEEIILKGDRIMKVCRSVSLKPLDSIKDKSAVEN